MARLADLEAEASALGLSVSGVELDINSDDAATKVMAGIIDERGAIDVLVNNAGYGLWGPVERLSVEETKAQFETNFFAALRLIKAVVPGMVKRGSGRIINMSSVEGRLATPFNGAYAASKFALEGMSEALRAELRPFGVFVSVVEPGLFRTEFQKNQVVGEGVDSAADASHYAPYIDAYRAKHGRYGHGGGGERAQHAAFAEHVVGLEDAALTLDAQHDGIVIFECEAPGEIGDAAIESVQRGDLRLDPAVFERGCRERRSDRRRH